MTNANSSRPVRDSGSDGGAGSPIKAALRRARWTIFWERLWPAVATLLAAVGLFLTLSWLGLWLWLPPLGRASAVAAFAVLTVAAAMPLAYLRIPAAADALRRLDCASGRAHRPATAIVDQLAVTPSDSHSLALWHAHVGRARAAVHAFKAGWPSPQVAKRDPYALRGLVLIACIATFVAAGGERWKRIAAAFDWRGMVLPTNFRVDAWVDPPGYTGKAPIILAGIHPGETAGPRGEAGKRDVGHAGAIAVPAGSTLVVRASGNLSLDLSAKGGIAPVKEAVRMPAGVQEHRFTITGTGTATLRMAGRGLNWSFIAIPDRPPTIELAKDPEEESGGSILLSYRVDDDYGVTQARAVFVRKDQPAAARGAHPLYGPPDFALLLPQARTRHGVGQTIKDLTDHPWAGIAVVMTLVARDEAGNEGGSKPFAFRLPERVFTKPLARALMEQRRNLALDARARPLVLTALDALSLAPERFTPNAGVYLGLRAIYWALVGAKSDDDLRGVVARMWQMAVDIEDGNVADARAALRNAEEALRQGLERGADDQEIKRLMDRLRAAMDRYMHAMAERLKHNPQLARPLAGDSRVLRPQDLKNMLDRLENLARSGATGAARELLQQFEQMMENLQMATPNMNGDDGDMMSSLDELEDMIRQQQQLRDRTFRQGQNQRREDAERGRRGQGGQQRANPFGKLQQGQHALRDQLDRLLEDLQSQGLSQGGQREQGRQSGEGDANELGRAGDAMGEAERELGQGDADGAVDSQGRALDALRKGAQGLAQSMQQRLGEEPGAGQNDRLGLSRAQQETDPLGRPLRGREYGDDFSVKIPGNIDVQRARRIIEELRRRYGDVTRPQEELDYIQRLLKGYY